MNSWILRVEPARCAVLGLQAWALHLAAAAAPWAAGCAPAVAAFLSAISLLALPATLGAIPGPQSRLRMLSSVNGQWSAILSDGAELPVRVDPATRVFAGLVVCRLVAGRQRYDWWLPRYALPVSDFRRLKVLLRCVRRGETTASC
jgi:hypothetical protein